MKKFIKKILFNLLLTEKQKEVIFKAIVYSEYKYRQRGNVNMAVNVHIVFDELSPFLGLKQTYTREEVDAIVDRLMDERNANESKNLKDAYNKGCRDATERIQKDMNNGIVISKIVVPGVVENSGDGKPEENDNVNTENKEQETTAEENEENTQQGGSGSEKDNSENQQEKS